MNRGTWWATVQDIKKELDMTEHTQKGQYHLIIYMSVF